MPVSYTHLDVYKRQVLDLIIDTPISPELLPPDAKGNISQKTEDIVGPYALHDFFLYYICLLYTSRQALALVMANMAPIDILILDEHTAALDPKSSERIMELTDEFVTQHQVTALMVTHNLRYAVEYGTRLLMMDKGQISIDKAGEEKQSTTIDDVLHTFNEISIECGN